MKLVVIKDETKNSSGVVFGVNLTNIIYIEIAY
jgi:hypothetical protein